MKKRNLVFIVVVTVVLMAVGSSAQFEPAVPFTPVLLTPSDSAYVESFDGTSYHQMLLSIWNDVKGLNQAAHPNPDLVEPGDTLAMPCGISYIVQMYNTTQVRHDCMWQAAERFIWSVIIPYRNGTLSVAQPVDTTEVIDTTSVVAEINDDFPRGIGILLGLLIIAAIAAVIGIGAWLLNRDKKKTDDSAAKARQQLERDRKFIPDPPDFRTAADDEANRTAAQAARHAFGKGVSIVGNIERGHITGEQVMFNADGTSRTEHFQNEPGYRATVRFPNGTERQVVCRWACFNPVYSIADAEFNGTFRPEGASSTQDIPAMTSEQTKTLESAIAGSANEFTADDLPEADETEAQSQTETPTKPEPANTEDTQIMEVGETQISKGRVTIKDFKGTVGQYERVVGLTTQHSLTSSADNEKPSK